MDWKQLIADLGAAGLTQVRVGELCGVAQSTISDLARGASKSPTYELGAKLVQLHTQTCRPEARDKSPVEEASNAG